uniref:Uncharacterized protein n=1 Tax=Lygus hesperus TaxID=30085 RepID=A0A146LHT3_LYGHE
MIAIGSSPVSIVLVDVGTSSLLIDVIVVVLSGRMIPMFVIAMVVVVVATARLYTLKVTCMLQHMKALCIKTNEMGEEMMCAGFKSDEKDYSCHCAQTKSSECVNGAEEQTYWVALHMINQTYFERVPSHFTHAYSHSTASLSSY